MLQNKRQELEAVQASAAAALLQEQITAAENRAALEASMASLTARMEAAAQE